MSDRIIQLTDRQQVKTTADRYRPTITIGTVEGYCNRDSHATVQESLAREISRGHSIVWAVGLDTKAGAMLTADYPGKAEAHAKRMEDYANCQLLDDGDIVEAEGRRYSIKIVRRDVSNPIVFTPIDDEPPAADGTWNITSTASAATISEPGTKAGFDAAIHTAQTIAEAAGYVKAQEYTAVNQEIWYKPGDINKWVKVNFVENIDPDINPEIPEPAPTAPEDNIAVSTPPTAYGAAVARIILTALRDAKKDLYFASWEMNEALYNDVIRGLGLIEKVLNDEEAYVAGLNQQATENTEEAK